MELAEALSLAAELTGYKLRAATGTDGASWYKADCRLVNEPTGEGFPVTLADGSAWMVCVRRWGWTRGKDAAFLASDPQLATSEQLEGVDWIPGLHEPPAEVPATWVTGAVPPVPAFVPPSRALVRIRRRTSVRRRTHSTWKILRRLARERGEGRAGE